MTQWFVHDYLYRVLNVKLSFEAKSPFRIGAGKSTSLTSPVDLQVLRININGREVQYIPGSSLKGVFRSVSEFIAKSNGINACMAGNECKDNYNRKLDDALRSRNLDEVRKILASYCLICKLYGSGSYASHIIFGDMFPEGDIAIGVKTGIAIDRRSGTAKRGALYTVEFIMPGSIFKGNITLINTPNYAIGLLSYVIKLINDGVIRIGGFKSRGFGQFSVNPMEINGEIIHNNKVMKISEVDIFEPLDEFDSEVNIADVGRNYAKLLERFRIAWDNYVSKIKHS
ncbi:MAG: CRISPR-associated RAMP protein Csx7 [Candidatus Methanomethylicia archaeon]